MAVLKGNSPYLFDEVTGKIVGIKHPDGSEDMFAFNPDQNKTLRNIATRCRTCNKNSASFTQMNSRTLHINRGGNTNYVQLVFPNWYASDIVEGNYGTTATITASIEYPVGVFTQVMFGNLSSGTIPAGGNITSDKVFIGIPNNATFWVRSYFVNASGVYVSPNNCTVTGGNAGEYCMAVASGGVDYTMTAGATDSPPYTNSAYFPLAILAMSSVPSVCCIGDSRTSGQGDNAAADTGMFNQGEIGRSLGRSLPYTLVAAPNDKLSDLLTRLTKRVAMAAYHTHVHVGYGINDLAAGQSFDTVQANLISLYAYFPTKKISQSTLAPQSSSSDGWATLANQSLAVSSPARVRLNTWIRTIPAPLYAVFDIAAVMQDSTDERFWRSPGYTADGTHATSPGYGRVAIMNAVDVSKII